MTDHKETVEQKQARIKELELALGNKGAALSKANERIQQLEFERGKRGQESLASVIEGRDALKARIDAALEFTKDGCTPGCCATCDGKSEAYADVHFILSTPTENGGNG